MDALITTASSTFATTFGFPLSDIISQGVSYLKLVAGTGLAFFTLVLPVLLGITAIFLVYKIARLGWGHWMH